MRPGVLPVLFLALILIFATAGCERKIVNEDNNPDQASLNSCFTCHGEDGLLLAAQGEWQNSIHASGHNVDYTNRGGTDCSKCHDHQGFLDFLATGTVDAPYENVSSIHCFTCHAPHTRGNLTLRTKDAYVLDNGVTFDHGDANLCANCHHSRLDASTITADQSVSPYWGSHHGPQADLLQGTNGYEFAGYTYGNTGHSNIGDNNGCVKCHMGNPQTHLGYGVGGHSFNMYDEDSGANLVGVCQECHPTADSYDVDSVQTEVNSLLEELATLLQNAGYLSGSGSIISQTIANRDHAGAVFNWKMIEEDRSEGIHNPAYIIDLLESSIAIMEGPAAVSPGTGNIASTTVTPLPAH